MKGKSVSSGLYVHVSAMCVCILLVLSRLCLGDVISPVTEEDVFPGSVAEIVLEFPTGAMEMIPFRGDGRVNVYFEGEEEGDARDGNDNGLDDVATEIVQLDLVGHNDRIGWTTLRLNGQQRSMGEMEENANPTDGRLDVPPFGPADFTVDSFFDVFVQIEFAETLHLSAAPIRIRETLTQKHVEVAETYRSADGEAIPLLDPAGQPSGLVLRGLRWTPRPVTGSIHGYKFEDLNGNGVWDADEPGLPGVIITVRWRNERGIQSLDTVTDDAGEFAFEKLLPGYTYTITETVPDGAFITTTPPPPLVIDGSREEYVATEEQKDMLVQKGMVPENVHIVPELAIGNAFYGSIHGYKFEDTNADGIDQQEPRLPGVFVTLVGTDGLGNPVGPLTMVTGTLGRYGFGRLAPGMYEIFEGGGATLRGAAPRSMVPTTPTSYVVELKSRQELVAEWGQSDVAPDDPTDPRYEMLVAPTLTFGNTYLGSIHGLKFDDLNGDGLRDPGEPGLPGVEILISWTDVSGNEQVRTTWTDPDGQYGFEGLFPGYSYTVTEPLARSGVNPCMEISGVSSGAAPVLTAARTGLLTVELIGGGTFQVVEEPGGAPVTVLRNDGAGHIVSAADGQSRESIFGGRQRVEVMVDTPGTQVRVLISGGSANTLRHVNALDTIPAPDGKHLLITGTECNDLIAVADDPANPDPNDAKRVYIGAVPALGAPFSGIEYDSRIIDAAFGNPTITRILAHGEDGDDVIRVCPRLTTPCWLSGRNGNDRLCAGAGSAVLTGSDGNDMLFGGPSLDVLFGNDGEDILYGADGPDRLYGGEDNDRMAGGDGNDYEMSGGPGDDLMSGGNGADSISGDAGTDTANRDADDVLVSAEIVNVGTDPENELAEMADDACGRGLLEGIDIAPPSGGRIQTTPNPGPIVVPSGVEFVATEEQMLDLIDQGMDPQRIVILPDLAFGNAVPTDAVEIDRFEFLWAEVQLIRPDGTTMPVQLSGPATLLVFFEGPDEGDAEDDDGDGRDEVRTELVAMELAGFTPEGVPLRARLPAGVSGHGVIEEGANATPGTLDVPPFGPPGGFADSFFDVFVEIEIGGEIMHTERARRLTARIGSKPPGPNDTYRGDCDPLRLLDPTGRDSGWHLGCIDMIPAPPVEIDTFELSVGALQLMTPDGPTEPILLSGTATQAVFFEGSAEGDAVDDDGDGRDEVQTELLEMDLHGTSSLGPVRVRLRTDVPSRGQIEEQANNTPGVLDVPPFAPGVADSFFDVFMEIEIGGQRLHAEAPNRLQATIRRKPPLPGDVFLNGCQPLELYDALGNPTGFHIGCFRYEPTPPVEFDRFAMSWANLMLHMPGGETHNVPVSGPVSQAVYFEGTVNGDAVDDDGNGRDEVRTELLSMSLKGIHPDLGPVHVRLHPQLPSLGQIEEAADVSTGVLDVPPFGPAGSMADSFFDVFVEIDIGGQTLHTEFPKRLSSRITHKPPAPTDWYQDCEPVELYDENGNPTGLLIGCIDYNPRPPVEIDEFELSLGNIILAMPDGVEVPVTLVGPSAQAVVFEGDEEGDADDDDGNGNDDVETELIGLDLSGDSPLGPVHVRIDPARQSKGQMEEDGNDEPGKLDVPPFKPDGDFHVDSFFDVFCEIEVGGQRLRADRPVRISTPITYKPAAPGETYTGGPNTGGTGPGGVDDIPRFIDDGGEDSGITLVGIEYTPIPLSDYGDAPKVAGTSGYPTLRADNGAWHVIIPHFRLGKEIDAEYDGQPTPPADGDDLNGMSADDEDGVTINGPLTPGSGASVRVEVTSPVNALINAWIDFGQDASWAELGDHIIADYPVTSGTHVINFSVPANANPGVTYARFRLAQHSVGPEGGARGGEVEDYLVRIREIPGEDEADLGDAPDSTNSYGLGMGAYPGFGIQARYPTVYATGSPPFGPLHLQPRAVAWLGAEVSLEAEADIGPDADGVNNIDPPNDAADRDEEDDGVVFPLALPHCSHARFNYMVTAAVIPDLPLYVNVWFDFNRDGDWNDTLQCADAGAVPEWAVQNQVLHLTSAGQHVITTPPFLSWNSANVQEMQMWMRITLSEQPCRPSPTGAPNGGAGPQTGYRYGETEDYLFLPFALPEPADWGDAPDPTYPTLLASNGASHGPGGPWLGDANGQPDYEPDGQPTPFAAGDDVLDGNDDEGGVVIPLIHPSMGTATLQVEINGGGGILDAWIDFNDDGVWDDPTERIYGAALPDGVHSIPVTVPASAVLGGTYARFRINSGRSLGPEGPADDGEVEDHIVLIVPLPEEHDFGDAPVIAGTPGYPTLLANNGARHVIAGPWLGGPGDAPDPEGDGQPDIQALGDDSAGADDENGVLIPVLPRGQNVTVQFEVSGSRAFVYGWIDFDQSRAWDPGEQVVAGFYPPGVHHVGIGVPSTAVLGPTYARFRISLQQGLGPAGDAPDGEVEDHVVRVIQNPEEPSSDLGDAPDSSNSHNLNMTAYPGLPVIARYPTVYATGSPPYGPIHQAPRALAWLGEAVSLEVEADIGADEDGITNLEPPTDLADLDARDDGVVFPLFIPHCNVTRFQYIVSTVGAPDQPLFVNVWFDFNRDGDWEDTLPCANDAAVPEWAVQNQQIMLPAAGTYVLSTPPFWGWRPAVPATGEIWMRITLSEEPVDAAVLTPENGGAGPEFGYRFGETEDYLFIPEIEDPGADWGDAPDPTYPTLLASNGAHHLPGGPWFGPDDDSPDYELDGQPAQAADGDDYNDNNDDEDGIQMPALIAGQNATVLVRVNGGGGQVDAWIDFNADGAWDDAAERIHSGFLPDGIHPIAVSVPADATVGPTYARFRINKRYKLPPDGPAPDGEVEDVPAFVRPPPEELDFGDAPVLDDGSGYPTLLNQNGARHVIAGPWLGDNTDAPDGESDGQPQAQAFGDDLDGNDDEDGVAIPVLPAGQNATIQFEVNGVKAFVYGWIDFNRNWQWDADEQIVGGIYPVGLHNVTFPVPSGAAPGPTFARFRISTERGLGPEGFAPNGEVEDYEVRIIPNPEEATSDLGDAPDSSNSHGVAMTAYPGLAVQASYPTVYGAGSPPYGPLHRRPRDLAWLGREVSLEAEADMGADEDLANNLDPSSDTSDEDAKDDGVIFPIYLPHCARTQFNYTVTVVDFADLPLFVNVWFDYNRDGDWDDTFDCPQGGAAPEWAVQNQRLMLVAPGSYTITTPAFVSYHPPALETDEIWMRITLSQMPFFGSASPVPAGGSGPSGGYHYGETEDYLFVPEMEEPEPDWGDAPDPYPTLLAGNGAVHLIGGPWLGDGNDQPDSEPDGQPAPAASGDDLDGNDDENGVVVPLLYAGGVATVQITVNGGGGYVDGWIDLNGDGMWDDATERVVGGQFADGVQPITFNVPAAAVLGRTYARFRINSRRQLGPKGLAEDGEVEDHIVFVRPLPEVLDFGDAPMRADGAGYPTLLPNGARHAIGGPWLGDAAGVPDAEPDGQPDPQALGDDSDGNDDENGVVIPGLIAGTTADIQFEVNGTPAAVEGWIDFDGNWNWDAGEQIVGGTYSVGTHTVQIQVPATAVLGETFARFRVSMRGKLGPEGYAPDGEVEDYRVTIRPNPEEARNDLGDAPDSSNSFGVPMPAYPGMPIAANYPTVYAAGSPPYGPLHLEPRTRAWLGEGVSLEAEADSGADEDAANNIDPPNGADDLDEKDDGVIFPINLPHCGRTRFDYKVTTAVASDLPLYVNVWFDFNRDGDWNDTLDCAQGGAVPEWAVQNQVLFFGTAGTHTVSTPLFLAWHPVAADIERLWMRITLSDSRWEPGTLALNPGGSGPGTGYRYGETEDYLFAPESGDLDLDWGDAPDPTYPTLASSNGAAHVVGGPWLGADDDAPDPEPDGQPANFADGDDSNDGNDDENGVQMAVLFAGTTATVQVMINGGGGHLDAWIDFNGDGAWDDAAERIEDSFYGNGMHPVSFPIPANAVLGTTFARFRINSAARLLPKGLAADGEVEDYAVFVRPPPEEMDFGDAPVIAGAAGYPTLLADNGARHVIGGPWLGSANDAPDAETDGQPDPAAQGDDLAGLDDENGVVISAMVPGQPAAVTFEVSGVPGFVSIWLDIDRNHQWGPSEQIVSGYFKTGPHTVGFDVPDTMDLGETYARARISTQRGLAPDGPAPDGEVEDLIARVVPDLEEPAADLGDAPDSSNSHGSTMTAYPGFAVQAHYPTVYNVGSPPYGPLHIRPADVAWLGDSVSLEVEADTGPDADPGNNIDAFKDIADLDLKDDGVVFPISLPHCRMTRFNYRVTVLGVPDVPLYVNVWFDYNRDGDWDDNMDCPEAGPVPEWAVQNQALSFSAGGVHLVTTPPFRAWNPGGGIEQIWMRITLSEQPWKASLARVTPGGAGPDSGYTFGETEDYLFVPEFEEPLLDWGDAPDPSFPTLRASNGAAHRLGGPWLGDDSDQPDPEPDGQPTLFADGDDTDGNDDENGVVVPGLIAGTTVSGQIMVNGGGGYVDGWIDFNGNGVWEEPGERVIGAVFQDGIHPLQIQVPAGSVPGMTFARFRINSVTALTPGGLARDGEVEDYPVFVRPPPQELDFGDAPEAASAPGYPTLLASNGARHVIAGPWLGSANDAPDAETDGQPDPQAAGDDLSLADDENGVVLPPLVQGQQATIQFDVSGAPAHVYGWIDLDQSMSWDAGELVVYGYYGIGPHNVQFDVPATALLGQTFARFRISSVRNLTPEGPAPDGEVEDYTVRVLPNSEQAEFDLGDAPDSSNSHGVAMPAYPGLPDQAMYPTVYSAGSPPYGPLHLDPQGLAWLGQEVSLEAEADIGPDADGVNNIDPSNGVNDQDGKDDGVLFPLRLPHCAMTRFNYLVTVGVATGQSLYVNVWFDFNRDGDWNDTFDCPTSGGVPEWAVQNQMLVFAAPGLYNVTTPPFVSWHPAALQTEEMWMRITLSEKPWGQAFAAPGAGGAGPPSGYEYGETEDYLFVPEIAEAAIDWGDAPDPTYPTLASNNGAAHVIGGPWLGDDQDAPDPEPDGQPANFADGDDSNDGNDDENGVQMAVLFAGTTATVQVMINGGGGHLDAWIDFNGDGKWDDAAERIEDTFYGNGMHPVSFPIPANAVLGTTFARFRINSAARLLPKGLADDGEVEDHVVFVRPPPKEFDYGDAPEIAGTPGYPTLLASNGAQHVIAGPWLGGPNDAPDAEADGQPDLLALGDDNASLDDENGVVIPTLLSGHPATIQFQVSGTAAFVYGWIDFDRSRTWDPGEMVVGNYYLPGTHSVNVTTPAATGPGDTYARFRITTLRGIGPEGAAPDGEVEDYIVTVANRKPKAIPQRCLRLRTGEQLDLQLAGQDPDGPDPLTVTVESGPFDGQLQNFDATAGTCTYMPDAGFTGTDRLTFTVFDGMDTSEPAEVLIYVYDGWLLTLNVQNADKPCVQLGVETGATAAYDPDYDLTSPPPGLNGAISFVDMDQGVLPLSRDVRATLKGTQWLLEVIAGDTDVELTWDTAEVPPERLRMWESDENGNPLRGTSIDMSVVDHASAPAEETTYYVIEEGTISQLLHLFPGWNLVSLHVEPLNTAPEAVFDAGMNGMPGNNRGFADGSRGVVYQGAVWEWKNDMGQGAYAPAQEIHAFTGYWVFVEIATAITVEGTMPDDSQGIQLVPGWNLIGVFEEMDAPTARDLLGPAWWYENNEYQTAVKLYPGRGYWLYSDEPATFWPFMLP